MKVTIDSEGCIGCELCVRICPEVFEMNDSKMAVIKTDSVAAELQKKCRHASMTCPVQVITVQT
ncbi:ferredoxin [Chitinispirillales bacterium ANBcel5]|uniref:ferredoxin n=1 Tax=Cellulosispirillum alkaliphilum TaxID=3039283 RepID=UPI002A582C47|nr:ferredoxin [Chitinispirillales bacterium ANBcel5]